MTLDEFLSRLQRVKPVGVDAPNKYVAACPAHEDRVQSLSLEEVSSRLLVHCHAGCATGSVVLAMGLSWNDLFLGPGGSGRVNLAEARPIRPSTSTPLTQEKTKMTLPTPPMIDAWQRALTPELAARLAEVKGWSGKTLQRFRVGFDGVRLTFPVYGPERVVGLVRYLPGGTPKTLVVGPRELFPMPETLPDGDVWLIEGEPDALSAHELGVHAVAVPGVATWKAGWAERFQGRRVTVCLDCDEQGRTAAMTRARELAEAGVETRVVDLFPGRSDGYDIGDALVAARADDRVAELCRYLLGLERDAWEGKAA